MSFSKKPVKGMTDFPPMDMRLRNTVLAEIRETYAQFGFEQIETPCMEHIGNLTSKQGGDNEKLIFRIQKRGAALARAWDAAVESSDPAARDGLVDTGLRYDLTVPLARFYANNKEQLPSPFRALQVGPVWRADQPAKGRFRQFVQCDIDVLGDATCLAEIELITGRSHQIRAHLASTGHPLIGDSKYADRGAVPLNRYVRERFGLSTQLLHAGRIGFSDSVSGSEILGYLGGKSFEAPLPARFNEILKG